MNIKQMRMIDTYVGGLACLFLDIFERVRKAFFSDRTDCSAASLKKILVTKYLGMGSILLATPMLRAIRDKFPKSKIVFLTFAGNSKFVGQIELIDEVLSIRTSSLPAFIKDFFVTLYRIRREKFDVVFDLEFFARFSTIVSYLSGARARIGYYLPRLWRGDLLSNTIHFNPYKHVTEIFSAQLLPFNIRVADFSLVRPSIKEETARKVDSLLKEKGIKGNEFVITVNINASGLSVERKWPADNFVELISHIARRKNTARLIFIGSGEDVQYVEGAIEMFSESIKGNIINLCGCIDIEECMALLKKSSLFITNDSGPLHIAAALGIPTVSFFGPESPSLYGPIGLKNKVFYAGIYCSPCLNVYNAKTAMCNGNNICMQEIKPAEVIAGLEKEGIL